VFIGVPPDASSEQLVALRQRAADVARRARAGEDFGQLVQAYSDDAGPRATAGDLGDVNPGTLPEAIADGEVADPIQGPNGFHVFRMISRRPITPPPFAEVRDRLYASLLNREMVRQQRIYLRELRRGAQIDNRLTPNANASAARPAEPSSPSGE
jgi:peptidylprolyl isomerase